MVDAYVVSVALDSDPVFGREAREAGRVLSRRYDAAGRTIVLAGSDGAKDSDLPRGSPDKIAAALARVAEAMDASEDVLILYTTSHGAPLGVVYNDGDQGYGAISPTRLWQMLSDLGIANRMILVSACYSGGSCRCCRRTPASSSPRRRPSGRRSAASATTTHVFRDALVNHALRKPQPLSVAVNEAANLIAGWENDGKLLASQPQGDFCAGAARWLAALEARSPRSATAPVGRPATELMKAVPAGR